MATGAVIPKLKSLDTAQIRQAFPGLEEMTYLNAGTEGLTPLPVLERLIELTRLCETLGHASWEFSKGAIETARGRVAAFLGVDSDEIAFAENATEAVNWVAASLNFNPEDEVLISLSEHPAMNFPWTYQRNSGRLRLNWFEISPDPAETLASVRAAITPRTRLIALSHVDRHRGIRVPAKALCELAAEAGALVLLDGAQALGQFPVNLRALGVDFYAANCHKWLCGPKGTGIFYVKQSRRDLLSQKHVGVGSVDAWDRAAGPALKPSASRFEYGTRDRATFAAIPAVLDWLESLGFDYVQSRIAELATRARRRAADRGWRVSSPSGWEYGSGLTSFKVPDLEGQDLFRHLSENHKIWVSHNPAGEVRVSTHYFNTADEIDRAFEAIDAYGRSR